jgi:hypothetical protein
MTILACVNCGCTDERACVTADGPCSWASLSPPICSACAAGGDEDSALERDDFYAGGIGAGADHCAGSTSGHHQPLFRGDGSAYCVHCRDELDTPEAA